MGRMGRRREVGVFDVRNGCGRMEGEFIFEMLMDVDVYV
jgi:hypothetical protein